MPSAVFSDEPEVEVTEGTLRGVVVSNEGAPLLEIVLDQEPDAELIANDTALLGVPSPQGAVPAIVELVPEGAEPVLDIIQEPEAVVDISAVGLQGEAGPVGPVGPLGPVGPQGPPGQSGVGASVVFTFTDASQVWNLPHNLGRKYVDVVTVDNNDEEVIGDVVFIDDFNARVEWYWPTSGYATVST